MEKIIKDNSKKENIFLTYWTKIKVYTKELYSSKYWIYKLIIFFSVLIIVLSTSFGVREAVLNSSVGQKELIPNFLEFVIVGNTGIAFSGFNDASVSFVFFIQSFPIVVLLIVIIFTKSIALDIGITLVIAGGLSNVIDRGLYDNYSNLTSINDKNYAVVDYLRFSFIPNSAIFNLPDVYVIIGIITVGIYVFYYYISSYIKEKNKKKKDDINGNKKD